MMTFLRVRMLQQHVEFKYAGGSKTNLQYTYNTCVVFLVVVRSVSYCRPVGMYLS